MNLKKYTIQRNNGKYLNFKTKEYEANKKLEKLLYENNHVNKDEVFDFLNPSSSGSYSSLISVDGVLMKKSYDADEIIKEKYDVDEKVKNISFINDFLHDTLLVFEDEDEVVSFAEDCLEMKKEDDFESDIDDFNDGELASELESRRGSNNLLDQKIGSSIYTVKELFEFALKGDVEKIKREIGSEL